MTDLVNARIAIVANCLVLLACPISAGNAFSRYLFGESSNGWLEIEVVHVCNGRVRIDRILGRMSPRMRIWIDIIGGLLFLLPIAIILTYFTWPWFVDAWLPRAPAGSSAGRSSC